MWAAGDCFSSVFGFVLLLLFQKVEHTLKTNQSGWGGSFKDPYTFTLCEQFLSIKVLCVSI